MKKKTGTIWKVRRGYSYCVGIYAKSVYSFLEQNEHFLILKDTNGGWLEVLLLNRKKNNSGVYTMSTTSLFHCEQVRTQKTK